MLFAWKILMCVLFAVATDQYTGPELKRALRRDIDDLARNKALQVSYHSSSLHVFRLQC